MYISRTKHLQKNVLEAATILIASDITFYVKSETDTFEESGYCFVPPSASELLALATKFYDKSMKGQVQ